MLNNIHYIPIIRTKDAELRGYSEVGDAEKNRTLPVFELTRSRRTSKVPTGDIHRRMEQIEKIVGDKPFVLDLTTHPDLKNEQIDALLDESDGFNEWYEFLSQYDHLNVFPVIHAYENGDIAQITSSAKKLQKKFGTVAFRAEVSDTKTTDFIRPIYDGISSLENIILIFDCGYLAHNTLQGIKDDAEHRVNELAEIGLPGVIVIAGSSFPRSVADHPQGESSYGELPMDEVGLYQAIRDETDANIIYGDHAAIHPTQYISRGGRWIPRVDAPLDETYLYTRYRREDGGYIRAAESMLNTDAYQSIGSWGDLQIEQAASGSPNGLSPSFWISVRLNIHVTRKSSMALISQT